MKAQNVNIHISRAISSAVATAERHETNGQLCFTEYKESGVPGTRLLQDTSQEPVIVADGASIDVAWELEDPSRAAFASAMLVAIQSRARNGDEVEAWVLCSICRSGTGSQVDRWRTVFVYSCTCQSHCHALSFDSTIHRACRDMVRFI